ncbi:hypothetical protein ANANG_G00227600 [Anguilla anguilla]|uniref:Uncharacterized protein n=1 Tax=Anguilla anguilla TaxID=7936 RepID=A0A9D3RPY1_ANGAN|nr:hypothetical protein ANANG_G00227600 [Anguilla anguilla]
MPLPRRSFNGRLFSLGGVLPTRPSTKMETVLRHPKRKAANARWEVAMGTGYPRDGSPVVAGDDRNTR